MWDLDRKEDKSYPRFEAAPSRSRWSTSQAPALTKKQGSTLPEDDTVTYLYRHSRMHEQVGVLALKL